jgi:glycosyltransferase involved in cell wall biosynthesis
LSLIYHLPMRISLLTPDLPPVLAGISVQSEQLARYLVERGNEVRVVAFTPGEPCDTAEHDARYAIARGFQIRRVARMQKWNARTLATIWSAVRWADVVSAHGHTLLTDQGFFLSRAARRRDGPTPFCVTLYGGEATFYRRRRGFDVPRHVYTHAEAVTAISRYIGTLLVSKGIPIDVRTIYAGIDVARFRAARKPRSERSLAILIVKRLNARSELQDLIQALAMLAQDLPTLRLHVVGEGDCRPRYEEFVRALGLTGRVSFLGWIPNEALPAHLADAALLCLPSSREELGIPLIEAAATGTPVVSTDVGGPTELIHAGTFGLLCRPNDPVGLAACIRSILTDDAQWETFSRNGVAYAERFDWALIAGEYDALFRRLVWERSS